MARYTETRRGITSVGRDVASMASSAFVLTCRLLIHKGTHYFAQRGKQRRVIFKTAQEESPQRHFPSERIASSVLRDRDDEDARPS